MLANGPRRPRAAGQSVAVATLLAVALGGGMYILHSKAGGTVAGLLSSRPLQLLGAALVVGVLAMARLYVVGWREAAGERWLFLKPLALSAGVVALVLLATELTLRSAARPTPIGIRVGELDLLPYDWERVRQSSRVWLERTRGDEGILDVEDADLGWNVGRGRQSPEGLYATSAEGLRSAEPGVLLAAGPSGRRVALVGDSFTFGEEVAYEQTWGQYLEAMLPAPTQVLNFGVPAHGMDQSLLKLRRDVLPWQPSVVVFSFLSASPLRNTAVYQFLRPDLRLPFTKPRFRLAGDRLELLNYPPLSAERLLTAASVRDLPAVEQDSEFEARHWAEPLFGSSYLARYVASTFPRWTPRESRFPDADIVALAVRLIRQLADESRLAGAVPVIVSLPVRADLAGGPTHYRDAVVRDLSAAGVDVVDVAPCLIRDLGIDAAFVAEEDRPPGLPDPGMAHYSPAGNRVVAACLRPAVAAALAKSAGTPVTD